jgi:hypothetical protein
MNFTNITEPFYEVVIKVDRKPLPPYYETFMNNLTPEQSKAVLLTLESCGEAALIFPEYMENK